MANNIIQLSIGFVLAGLLGYVAYRLKSLSPSGAWATTLTGGLIFGLGGISWAIVLVTFFISSSILSRLSKQNKLSLEHSFEKGSYRDSGQVFANGGAAILLVIFQTIYPEQLWPWLAFLGAMATVTADTWATEIGVLSKSATRLITTGRKVDRGTSGGVSALGTLATIAGGVLIGLVASLADSEINFLWGLVLAALAGLSGSLLDSMLGATVQAIFYCGNDEKETEQHPVHSCGEPTKHQRGWLWLRNDHVNLISSIFGGLVAVGMWALTVR
ncbi:MAG: DUF92 domain-containing protein [Chloroflexota bacterium]